MRKGAPGAWNSLATQHLRYAEHNKHAVAVAIEDR